MTVPIIRAAITIVFIRSLRPRCGLSRLWGLGLRTSTLVRTERLLGIDHTPHAAECSGPACNTRGEEVLPFAIQPTECHDVMVINHYFTKSRQDWEFKRRRGRGDSLEPYQDRVFADVAGEALIEDTRASRFVPQLRALLRS